MNSDMTAVWNRCNEYISIIEEMQEDESIVSDWVLDATLSCDSIKTYAVYHAIERGKSCNPDLMTKILDEVHGDLVMISIIQERHKEAA